MGVALFRGEIMKIDSVDMQISTQEFGCSHADFPNFALEVSVGKRCDHRSSHSLEHACS